MRISDWSSDVCSSDLCALQGSRQRGRDRRCAPDNADQLLGHHGEAEGNEQTEDRVRGVETPEDEAIEEDADKTDGHRRQHDRRYEAEHPADFHRDVGAERVKSAVRQVHDAAEAEDERQAQRSEEHTSELQELMRITYA